MSFPKLTIAVLLGLATELCRAIVPRSCIDPDSLRSRTCCPNFWGDGTPCGQASGRGMCGPIHLQNDGGPGRDFRSNWPTYFFSNLCQCSGNFWGTDCGECKPGWAGAWCDMAIPPAHRPECSSLSPEGRHRLISALHLAKNSYSDRWVIYASVGRNMGFRRVSLYDAMVWAHYIMAKTPLDRGGPRYGHGSVGFLTWHRRHLMWFESELRNITGDPRFAICAWKWSGKHACDICKPDFFGENDNRGHLVGNFANWTSICAGESSSNPSMRSVCPEAGGIRIERNVIRDAGAGRGLPTDRNLALCLQTQALDAPPYNLLSQNTLRNMLEGYWNPLQPRMNGMHNRVHVFLGGFMASAYTAPNDPIFLPVHCEVDRIFETWLERRDRSTVYPRDPTIAEGHRWNDYISPFLPLCTNQDMLDRAETLGYTYHR